MDSWLSLKQCSTKLSKDQSESDRLSRLPDHLLIRILSLLPTKYAVVTCVLLNKRMLLASLTALDFDSSPICHCAMTPNQIERFPSFVNFLESVLQAHQSPFLTRFRINLMVSYYPFCIASPIRCCGHNEGCLPDLKSTQMIDWIAFPLTRCGLRELELCFHLRGPLNQTPLPPQVFMKETLEVLKLDVNLCLDGISTFCLPKLKTLHLNASLSEDAFLTRLVLNCPLLEELTLSIKYLNHVQLTKISSPSLRRLYLFISKHEQTDNSDLVVLDTPNLEDLRYTDNMALQYSITSMPRLVKANICFKGLLGRESLEINCQKLTIFLRAFSNVRHLSLDGVIPQVLQFIEGNEQLPLFHDLIHLQLHLSHTVERNTLLAFLYRCPNLKTLVFPGGLGAGNDAPLSQFNERRRAQLEQAARELNLATIPCCCSFNLKRVFVYNYHGNEEEQLYIGFLLKYSLVLEELVMLTNDPTTNESTLQNLPRASPTCSIQLQLHHGFGPFPQLY